MKNIIGFFSGSPTWREVSEKEYKKIFDHDPAILYLKQEILESVQREMGQILNGSFAGFYAGLRFLFAEVTYLSQLYWGRDEAKLVARFMRKFKILTPTSGLHYEVFRHGLMHTHHPKFIRYNRKIVPWYISNDQELKMFGISNPIFRDQIERAIGEFIKELETEKGRKKKNRLNKFLKGLVSAGRVLSKRDLKPYARNDFRKIDI